MIDYAGPTGKLTYAKAVRLRQAEWRLQPKIDGMYARVTLDGRGLISQIASRTGRICADEGALSLLGVRAGEPDSVLHGELEVSTEAGLRAARERGWSMLHVFDVSRLGGRDIRGLPYRQRRDFLMRAQARAQAADDDRDWWTDDRGCVHHERTGRFSKPVPRGWRRCPVVEQWPLRALGERWRDDIEIGGGEGLVAVALGARFGTRGAKLKIKRSDTIDATVHSVGGKLCRLRWCGVQFVAPIGRWPLAVGDVVEVMSTGYYEQTMIPRHPRIARIRADLN